MLGKLYFRLGSPRRIHAGRESKAEEGEHMLSLEEKQALLVKRWEKLNHKAAGTKLNAEDVRKNIESLKSIKGPSAPQPPESAFERLARSIWEASGRDIKSMVPEGKKNGSWNLLNLKKVLEWHGNIAIGEDKSFDGWISLVPPSGVVISYFGPGALDRAREMAKKIQHHYD
jgi:hypothetical protein